MPTSPFSTQCGVVINNNYDTVGTLTRATFARLTPDQVKALFTDGTQWYDRAALLRTQFEMRACGTRRFGMYDWLMSSNKPGMGKLINIRKVDRGPSLIEPFIMGRQNSIVNADYWVISCGAPQSGYTAHVATVACSNGTTMTGPLTAPELALGAGADRVIRVQAGYGLPADAKHFLPGHSLYILNRAGDGSAKHGEWKILAAHVAADGTFVDVLLKSQNSFSTATADTTPTTGVVLVGINNVNDFEKWCINPANVNPVKRVPFWYQVTRRVRQVDSAYREMLTNLKDTNEWFEQFADLPLAERNRQDELTYQKQVVNAFFFGRPISNAQRLEGSPNWSALDPITSVAGASVDPGTSGQTQAYRANMVGVYEQLRLCSQVIDRQNAALNVTYFCERLIYDIYRARQTAGRPATDIDVYTDSITADEFMTKFIDYHKGKVGDIVRVTIEEGKNEEFGFAWRKFKLHRPLGVCINLITHEFFDDILNTFTTLPTGSQASRGRFLAVLDIGKGGSIYPAVLGSNRKYYKTGDVEKLAQIDSTFACVMENPTVERTLTSETITAIVECPKHSVWVENFTGIVYNASADVLGAS